MGTAFKNAFLSCTNRRITSETVWESENYHVILIHSGSLRIITDESEHAVSFIAFRNTGSVRLLPDGRCEVILLELDPAALAELPGGIALLSGIISENDLDGTELHEAGNLLFRCLSVNADDASFELSLISHYFMLLHILTRHVEEEDPLPAPKEKLTGRRMQFYRRVYAWLLAHAEENPGQRDAAEAFGITPQYLGRFLKDTTGLTFRELIRNITEKKAGILSEYKRTSAGSLRLPGEDIGSVIKSPAAFPESAALRPYRAKEYHVRLAPKNRLRRYWTRLINLGYAVNLKDIEIDRTLERVQSEGGFEYGRICRITDLIMTFRVGDRTLHDYSQAFSLIDHLLSAGITPFLELGNKSFTIQETTSINFTPLSPVDSRRYYSDLLLILPDFLRAAINHYGQENFDSWYFEISYMYTDTETKETFGLVQYSKTFRKIYAVIRSFSEKCRIGGPGFNDWSSPGKVLQAVRLLSSHGVVPDFFSAYCYPVDISDEKISLSEDPDMGLSRIDLFARTVREFYPDAEIWITEFNSNLSSRSFLNDSCYQAAFLAKMILRTSSMKITALGYYLLSDAPLRYLDSLDFMFGGWGLFTDMALPKASWNLYRMMAMLGHYRILLSENVLITANSRGSVRILLYRCCHPNETFCGRNVERDDLMHPERIFADFGTERISVSCDNVLKGTYILKEYRINSACGNIYSAWRELGFLYPKDTRTADELEIRSALLPSSGIHVIKDGHPFEISVTLSGNEVVLITLELYTSIIKETL